jgi:hypothetical protein
VPSAAVLPLPPAAAPVQAEPVEAPVAPPEQQQPPPPPAAEGGGARGGRSSRKLRVPKRPGST